MTAQRLDGSATLKVIKAELTERVGKLREQGLPADPADLGDIL